MKFLQTRTGLRARLLLIVLFAVLPAFALNAYTAVSQRQQALVRTEQDAMNMVQLAIREQNRLIASTEQLLAGVAKLPDVKNPTNYARCHQTLAEAHKPFPHYRLFAVALANGEVFCRSSDVRRKVNISDRGYFQRAVESRGFGIGNYQIGRATDKSSINFGQAILDDRGNVHAVVFMSLDLDWLNELVAFSNLLPNSTLTVIDNEGLVLAANPNELAGKPMPNAALKKMLLTSRSPGTMETRDADGVERIYAYAPLHNSPSGNAYISVGMPKAGALAAANQEFTRNLVLLLIVATLVFIAAWAGTDIFVRRRLEAERALRDSEARFRSLSELSSDWYWEQNQDFRFTSCFGAVLEGGGLESTDTLGKTRWELSTAGVTESQWHAHKQALQAHHPFRDFEYKREFPDGRINYISVSGVPVFGDNGDFTGYRGIGRDISERKRNEERIQYLANHDGLTSLPNRAMFSEMLNAAIQTAHRYKRHFAVLFIDLDRFKIINDTLGHEVGDQLLKEVGNRLLHALRASDVVARLGGDEFVVLAHEICDKKTAAAVAHKVISALVRPVVLLGQEYRVTASVGVCLYPSDAQDEQSLMKNADVAMYRAKEEGKNNFQFYSQNIKTQSFERLSLETSLRHALEQNQFFLHYQAKVDLNTDAITGAEALLRWQHPELGVISPMHFIPVAEDIGLIVPIGRWVLHTACAQNLAWQRQGAPPLCMSVNLSPRQFVDPDLLKDIAAALQTSGMSPTLLELEITESMVMGDVERATRVLAAIKQMGVRLAIDDFGTGYSSLAQIKRFPIDTLKVDRSFIREIPQNPEDRAITEAIIAMGKTLSLTVVAEGVETEEQKKFLRERSCDEMQGYYFAQPVAPDRFADLLRQHAKKNGPLAIG